MDLYKEGYAPCILMVENWEPGYELLESRGVKVPRDVELKAMIGTQLGVPEEAFIILPGDAKSTQEEAQIISRYLQDNPQVDKILLVTSKYHSRRSAIIFRWVIGDTEILSCPTPYDNYNADSWWRTRQDAKSVVMEYAKLANFYLLDRWR